MASKKGFLLLNNQIEIVEDLTDEQAGQLLKAFYDYNNGKEIKLKGLMKSIFKNFKVVFDENEQKYQETCKKNKENIEKYWERVRQQQNTTVYDRIPSNTMATNININKNINTNINTNKIKYKNNNNINNSESENIIDTPTASPTLANIISYSKNLGLNDKEYCEKFYNHYESIGWVNGTGQQIKNWKLVFNNWLKKDKIINVENEPPWFNKEIKKKEISEEEQEELKKLIATDG